MSDKFKMNTLDWKKILMGAIIAGVGAGLLYAINFLGNVDFGLLTPAITALLGVIANIVRKFLANNK